MRLNMYIHKDITLQTKVHIVRAMVSPVVMHGCKSWIMKKAECQGVDDLQGVLACCDLWGLKESDTTERLN